MIKDMDLIIIVVYFAYTFYLFFDYLRYKKRMKTDYFSNYEKRVWFNRYEDYVIFGNSSISGFIFFVYLMFTLALVFSLLTTIPNLFN